MKHLIAFCLAVLLLAPWQSLIAQSELYHVAIIDRFYPPLEAFQSEEDKYLHTSLYGLVDIDKDYRKERLYHGDIVQLIAHDPSITFLRYPINGQASPMREILHALTSINDRFEFTPIDSLVLSWESSTLISAFEEPLRLEHRERYIETIRQWGQEFPAWQDTYLVIRALEKLAAQGVQVFTISGNSGPRTINTLSFAAGVTTVGAIETELHYFIANNVFVDTHEQAAYALTRIDNQMGQPLGYDIDGDGCYDIPINDLTSQSIDNLPDTIWPPIKGSSFAAPKALKKALIKKPSRCNEALVASSL
ncbi:hypothetical protein MAQ5080_03410 [Marinomonas aquimarina]|uniref:Peptidase S8/S53 domain-containing protein n=1 Tax=Marinomonas aquimarina TaxID=295068 RepID=A0A1A8TRV6_9GAMM|nr:hypothetical protein [Marinomonas aquimarina]SBS36275.1 hypothetical protein MAQ5080_03410 [Marinomonas aquimarina]